MQTWRHRRPTRHHVECRPELAERRWSFAEQARDSRANASPAGDVVLLRAASLVLAAARRQHQAGNPPRFEHELDLQIGIFARDEQMAALEEQGKTPGTLQLETLTFLDNTNLPDPSIVTAHVSCAPRRS